jgi:hypothetical protein
LRGDCCVTPWGSSKRIFHILLARLQAIVKYSIAILRADDFGVWCGLKMQNEAALRKTPRWRSTPPVPSTVILVRWLMWRDTPFNARARQTSPRVWGHIQR